MNIQLPNKRLLLNSVLAVSLSAVASVSVACDRPDKPTVPNGAESNMDQMITGQTAVKEYVAAGDTYIQCLEAEEAASAANLDKEDENAMAEAEAVSAERVKTHNEVVDEMTSVAAEWKESMTTYKAKAAEAK